MEVRRTTLAPWAPLLADPAARAALGRALRPLLVPEVTARLPDDLGFDPDTGDIDAWIDATDAQAQIRTITRNDTGALAGLLLLYAAGPDSPDLMVGYFLGPDHWGRGLASDMLAGLVAELDREPRRRLVAGTEADNRASQRVLEKAGFRRDATSSAPDRIMFSRLCGM